MWCGVVLWLAQLVRDREVPGLIPATSNLFSEEPSLLESLSVNTYRKVNNCALWVISVLNQNSVGN